MTDSIAIIGGGAAGLTAALHCAQAGARVVVVERGPIVGGRLAAAIIDEGTAGENLNGAPLATLDTLEKADNLEIFTLADLEHIRGRPGNFTITVRARARFVTDTCTRCNRCRAVCPVVAPNEYDAALSYRKAIYTPLPHTLPQPYVIDIDSCLNTPPNYLPCNRCTEVCDDDSIHFDLPVDQRHERQVGALILAVGFATPDDDRLREFGYGAHPDIVTTTELDRLLTAPGPTGGFVAKPSTEEYPDSVLMIVDELTPFATWTAVRQISQLVAQDVGNVALLVTTQPPADNEARRLPGLPPGVSVRWGLLQKVEPGDENTIDVSYAAFDTNGVPTEPYDMVVLSASVRPAEGLGELAGIVGVERDKRGFIAAPESATPAATSRPGVYVAGGAGGPVTLPVAIADAKTAAAAALSELDPRLLQLDDRPPQTQETPATGAASADDKVLRARIERALYALLTRGE